MTTVEQPDVELPRPSEALSGAIDDWAAAFERDPEWHVRIPWESMRNRALSLREKQLLREFYSARYQTHSSYTARHPWHKTIARWRHEIARAVFGDLGKTLDGGCASGEVVSTFRELGTDCWGFDICPDLLDTVYPEARPYVRMGRMDAIPYSEVDGFRTLVSYDVIEHVPIDCLEQLPTELDRLGIQQIACVIAADLAEGHITIQNTAYYESLFARAGFRIVSEVTDALRSVPGPIGWIEDRQQVYWGSYEGSGNPPNAWNGVPGLLFFERG